MWILLGVVGFLALVSLSIPETDVGCRVRRPLFGWNSRRCEVCGTRLHTLGSHTYNHFLCPSGHYGLIFDKDTYTATVDGQEFVFSSMLRYAVNNAGYWDVELNPNYNGNFVFLQMREACRKYREKVAQPRGKNNWTLARESQVIGGLTFGCTTVLKNGNKVHWGEFDDCESYLLANAHVDDLLIDMRGKDWSMTTFGDYLGRKARITLEIAA